MSIEAITNTECKSEWERLCAIPVLPGHYSYSLSKSYGFCLVSIPLDMALE